MISYHISFPGDGGAAVPAEVSGISRIAFTLSTNRSVTPRSIYGLRRCVCSRFFELGPLNSMFKTVSLESPEYIYVYIHICV